MEVDADESDSTEKEVQETCGESDADSGKHYLSRGVQPAPGISFEFKKPLLTGPRKGKLKLSQYKPSAEEEQTGQIPIKSGSQNKSVNKTISPAELLKPDEVLPYKEPAWSGLPTNKYYFEVLKSGQIIEEINLSDKSFHVFGRSQICDTMMRHPTVSRFHCALQYRETGDDENPPGYYVYDFGSINGTFLNKNRLKPKVYVRMHVGHLLKIGWSSRNFILQGPESDAEPESDLTITEVKELQKKERLKAELAEKERKQKEQMEEDEIRRKEEDGIDWGMGEDADEETDLSENPFAATQNEELYINDPKKTLRGWFEREGYELEYNCEEKGYGQFVCRVEEIILSSRYIGEMEGTNSISKYDFSTRSITGKKDKLPIDNARGLPIVAEAVVRGKKKEAVVHCALEACRILDQHGLLRQSNHESRKRKAKNWEDNDYYDSDEDTFLDRTGTVEKKRQIRMKQAGVSNAEVHTYQSLVKKHEGILKEIKNIETELEQSMNKADERSDNTNEDEDALDAFMSTLSANERRDKKNIAKLKSQLASLKQEEVTVRNLANVAKPAEMPKLEPIESQTTNKPLKYSKLPIIGKRKTTTKKPIKEFQEKKIEEHDSGEEVDSD